jgi:hypothetical protein
VKWRFCAKYDPPEIEPILLLMDTKASDWERQQASVIAQQALQGQVTMLEAVRALVSLAHTDAIQNEADRDFIIGIDSETDHLPVGGLRSLWAADALIEKDVQIERAEAHWRAAFLEICKRIVAM